MFSQLFDNILEVLHAGISEETGHFSGSVTRIIIKCICCVFGSEDRNYHI